MSLQLESGKKYYDEKKGIFVTPREHSEYRRRFTPKKESFSYTTGNEVWDNILLGVGIVGGGLFVLFILMVLFLGLYSLLCNYEFTRDLFDLEDC